MFSRRCKIKKNMKNMKNMKLTVNRSTIVLQSFIDGEGDEESFFVRQDILDNDNPTATVNTAQQGKNHGDINNLQRGPNHQPSSSESPIKTTPRAANARHVEDMNSDVASDTPILL